MEENYRNLSQDKRLDSIESHIDVINTELGEIKQHLCSLKTDVSWLKKFFWIVATASIAGLITGIIQLFLSLR